MLPEFDCDHTWGREDRDQPLACLECGTLWPDDDQWPPEPLGLVNGYGNLDHAYTVRELVAELHSL